jgi:hypothetical protein
MTPNDERYSRRGIRAVAWAAVSGLVLAAAAAAVSGQDTKPVPAGEPPEGFALVKKTTHTGTAPWTDTGIDVKEGQEFYFEAEGAVSLQKDNPVASCGPEGLNLRTMQQPLSDQNLGCLIGRVLERTEVEEDKDRGEKTVREFGPMFGIGKQARLAMPASGRLFIGVNENVTKDNDGAFSVSIFRKTTPLLVSRLIISLHKSSAETGHFQGGVNLPPRRFALLS